MKASLSWLRGLLPALHASNDQILHTLSTSGLKVVSHRFDDDLILTFQAPHRPDLLSHVGLARELSVLFRIPFLPQGIDAPMRIAKGQLDSHIRVTLEDASLRLAYAMLAVEMLRVEPSPPWLQKRLESLALAPINNIVDSTRLVFLEFGLPVQVYDLDRIEGPLRIRRAKRGEMLASERGLTFDEKDVVVVDDSGLVSLAGIVTTPRVRVGASTSRVVVECVRFDRRSMADSRFFREVGTSSLDVLDAAAQAVFLATHLAGGAAVPSSIRLGKETEQEPHRLLSSKDISDLSAPLVKEALERMGYEVVLIRDEGDGQGFHISGCEWRGDLTSSVELLKELRRIHMVWKSIS